MARATQNPFYTLVVSAVFLLLRDPSLAPLRYKSIRKHTQAEHLAIVDAVAARDEDAAAEACIRHLNRVRSGIEELFAQLRATGDS